MDIVPGKNDLIVEAKVNPTDIDLLSPGMTAQKQHSHEARTIKCRASINSEATPQEIRSADTDHFLVDELLRAIPAKLTP